MSQNKSIFSSSFASWCWSILVAFFSFYAAFLMVEPTSFWRFMLFFIIGAIVYNQLIYWVARLVLFFNDRR